MTDRDKYADMLIDAVGSADEKYVREAQNYVPKKRLPAYVKASIGAAASLLLIILIAFPVVTSSVIFSGVARGNTASSPAASVQQRMYEGLASAQAEKSDTAETDGAALIWKDASDNGYNVIPISGTRADAVVSKIGTAASAPDGSGIKIWIRTEKGEYISPQLKRSPGNTDCVLFDYSPETAVSDGAAAEILSILNERKQTS